MKLEEMEEEESEILLETDWIHEFEKIVDENIYYPSESMTFLPIYCLMIEKNIIIHVSKKRIPFDLRGGVSGEGGSRNILKYLQKISEEPYWIEWLKEYTEFVGSEEALDIENRRLEKRAKQFSLSDVLLFNVDFQCEGGAASSEGEGAIDIYNSHSQKYMEFFRGYSAEEWKQLDSLEWKDSVFLFHSINSVFFVFRDVLVIPIEVQDLGAGGESGGGGGGGGEGILMEMPVTSILISPSISRKNVAGNAGGGYRGTRKVHFGVGDGDGDDDMMESESDSSSETETLEGWGKGKWLQKRKKNRRKTEKRKHVFTSALIRSLFEKK